METAIREALLRGDLEAVVQLAFDAHGPALAAFVRSRVPAGTDAEEVMAEVAAALWGALPTLQLHTSMRGYLFQMARHSVHRHLDREVRRGRLGVPLDELPSGFLGPEAVRTDTPAYLKTANKDLLAALRGSLSPEERTLLQLRIDQGLAFREIAQAMAEEGDALDERALTREAARWRKRYQLTKDRLRTLAQDAGLLDRT